MILYPRRVENEGVETILSTEQIIWAAPDHSGLEMIPAEMVEFQAGCLLLWWKESQISDWQQCQMVELFTDNIISVCLRTELSIFSISQ